MSELSGVNDLYVGGMYDAFLAGLLHHQLPHAIAQLAVVNIQVIMVPR
jgi:hypothetical protein